MKFSLLGIPITIQQSVLLIGGVYLLFGIQAGEPIGYALSRIAIIFGSILVHEGGHAASATAFKLGPVEILLHGLGGLTRHRRADAAWKDLVIQLAGPAAGFILAALAFVPAFAVESQLAWFAVSMNIFWSVFNLIPVFPMDGGQALHSISRIFAPKWAWPVTYSVGLVGGVLMALGGLALQRAGGTMGIFLLFLAVMFIRENWEARKNYLHDQLA